jgi:ADP-ribose pyrophosphatase YjhB (NUDIX family)
MIEHSFLRVNACILKDGKYLVVFDTNHHYWKFPGGKVGINESIEAALVREVKEELGIDIKIGNYLGYGQEISSDPKKDRKIFFFQAEMLSDNITLKKDEVSDFKFVDLNQLRNLKDIEPALKDFLRNSL